MKIIKEPFMKLQPEHFISVTFETEVKDADSVRELIEKCAKNVLERENIPFDAEIDARVVDAEEIRRLNAEFRDKDAVNAALLCCEMAAWYRAQGMTLAQAMDALYEKFGYYRNELQSVVLPGEDGMERMSAILTALRAAPPHTLASERVTRVRDYLGGLDGLPASDVLELRTAHVKVIVRPSGTEPKLKLYYSAHARTMAEAAALCAAARQDMSARLGE